mmetsp:Transcript_21499/g.69202  ORF Transcript_21499/g.69202 Transcript_21499/m.69202 type:complete len:137 (+) Transcript_21499:62-472(+)
MSSGKSLWRLLRLSHDRGDLYLGLSAVGFATYVGLAYREAQGRDLRLEMDLLRRDQERALREARPSFSDARPLYGATVARGVGPAGFDGPVALPRVSVGQRVAVLEESVGPDGAYSRCRNDFGEGLYLAAFLDTKE